jgi:hypothetical protein
MKKIILSALTILAVGFTSNAQDTLNATAPAPRPKQTMSHANQNRLNLYGAYVFDDNVQNSYDSYNYFDGTIKGGFQYGAGIEFMVKQDYGVELLWLGQSTTTNLDYLLSGMTKVKSGTFNLDLNYAMLGFGRHATKPGGKIEGYGGLMLGCLFANVENPENGSKIDDQFFAWGIRLGGNIWATNKIGLKLQAQLLSAVQSAGGAVYFGTGGAGAGVSMYSTMYQFSIGGGLVYALGK